MLTIQVSVIIYFNLLLGIRVTAEEFSESHRINEDLQRSEGDPFIASLNPNREKTYELLEKNIDKSTLKEKFYADQSEKIIQIEFSDAKKKQRLLALVKYLDSSNKNDSDLALKKSSGHYKRIHRRHNRLRHAKRKKLDELEWVMETGKNFSSERNFSGKKSLSDEKTVLELRGKNHKKFHDKKYSLNHRGISGSIDEIYDKESDRGASLNSVRSDTGNFQKFSNSSTVGERRNSQFAKEDDDAIINSEVDLQLQHDASSRIDANLWMDEMFLRDADNAEQDQFRRQSKLSPKSHINRIYDEKEIIFRQENESPSFDQTSNRERESIALSNEPSTYQKIRSSLHREKAIGGTRRDNYSSRSRTFSESYDDDNEGEAKKNEEYDATNLLNTDHFIIPNSSEIRTGPVGRSSTRDKSISYYKSSLKTKSRTVDSSKYSTKLYDKNIPFRLNYKKSLDGIFPNETVPHSKGAKSSSIIRRVPNGVQFKEHPINNPETMNAEEHSLTRETINAGHFTGKHSLLKLLIKKPATNIRIRKSKQIETNSTYSKEASSQYDRYAAQRREPEVMMMKDRFNHNNSSLASYRKNENVTPHCRFIDSFRKSVMASCQKQGQIPASSEQLNQDPCYSIRDLLIVVIMTSLVNLLAGVIITLAFCCLPLRECCFLAHGNRVTLTTRNIHSGFSRNNSEEDTSGSVGCLEACLPDISYQRHIARGFSKGRSFGMAQMFHQLTGSLGETCPWERHHRRLRKDSMLISRRSLSLEDLSIT